MRRGLEPLRSRVFADLSGAGGAREVHAHKLALYLKQLLGIAVTHGRRSGPVLPERKRPRLKRNGERRGERAGPGPCNERDEEETRSWSRLVKGGWMRRNRERNREEEASRRRKERRGRRRRRRRKPNKMPGRGISNFQLGSDQKVEEARHRRRRN